MTQETENDNNRRPRSPGVLKILQSILAGAFRRTVRSAPARKTLPSHSPWPYIVAGLLFTAAFVVGLILVVQVVLAGH